MPVSETTASGIEIQKPSAELGTLSGSPNNAVSVTLAPEKNVSYEAGVT